MGIYKDNQVEELIMADKNNLNDVLAILSQLSKTTKSMLKSINIQGLSETQKIVSQNAKLVQIGNVQSNIGVQLLKPYLQMKSQASEMFRNSYANSGLLSNYSAPHIHKFAELQATASILASIPNTTGMIKDIQVSLAASDISGCIKAVQEILDNTKIAMPNLTLLKTSKLLESLKEELNLPIGFATDMRRLNKSSAVHLLNNDKISFRSDIHRFVNENNSESTATVPEMNVICSAKDVLELSGFDEIFSENELMDFMNLLDESPMMAMNDNTGKKIFNAVGKMLKTISFDKNEYFHCRARGVDEAPYVWEQMKTAPYGINSPGRYNHAGQPYFYFTDTVEGAQNEVYKHISENDKKRIVLQTVKIGVNSTVRLLDISAKKLRGLNIFLKYIRFPLGKDTSRRPRVYLIPSFVSECCRKCGLDGIKYYGGKDYSNYVTWNDGYFNFIQNM